ncbi:MAG TPA: signal peptidase I [Aliidongia sp.]|nr:signal peptidase I [Aliidongia sp.]
MSESTKRAAAPVKSGESITDILKTIITVVAAVLVVRTFAFEPFNIPSGSMIPTLLVGDYVFVSKFSYGYSKYSFPFYHPNFDGRFFNSLPKRGDVAVFKLPRDPSIDYIKRIVGLPGDKIQVIDGLLYINQKPVERVRTEDFVDDETGTKVPVRQFLETLPNGVQHPILQPIDNGPLDNTPIFEVPPDHVFAMGDNRDNSADSRLPPWDHGVGYVPIENLVGRADFRFFSFDGNTPLWQIWNWPFAIRYSRLFTGVH